MSIPISTGSGEASVAAEAVGGLQYQQVEILGQGGSSTLAINADGSLNTRSGGSIATVIIGGSIAASFTPPANQSVSGTVQTDVRGSVATVIIGGSIAATFSPPANQSVSGTVQTDVRGSVATVIIGGSIAASFTPPANQSVSGTVDASQIGAWRTSVISSTPSSMLAGASIFGQLPGGTAVLGSVAALQGTNPWIVTSSIAGGIFPVSGSVAATITNTTINVSGSVAAFQAGTQITSIVSTVPSSVIVGASIFGQLPAGTAPLGSVAVLQGTNPWVNTNVGSIITVVQANSIAGTYAEDTAHTSGSNGLMTLGVRNDIMASITSADVDYSPIAVGPVGETIIANAPITKWVQGTADFRQGNAGASIIAIASGGSSVFTYITGVQIANLGSASVLVTLASGGSTLGYTIAPAGGGSNLVYPNGLKTPANFGFAGSISAIASVLLSAQGFTSRT